MFEERNCKYSTCNIWERKKCKYSTIRYLKKENILSTVHVMFSSFCQVWFISEWTNNWSKAQMSEWNVDLCCREDEALPVTHCWNVPMILDHSRSWTSCITHTCDFQSSGRHGWDSDLLPAPRQTGSSPPPRLCASPQWPLGEQLLYCVWILSIYTVCFDDPLK